MCVPAQLTYSSRLL